jgi:phenylpyruvate tautomerase PptA (4-oxalocrotonate tautomerase family)
MLSKDFISQLVSICSELEKIDLPSDTVAYEKRLRLIENISALLTNHSQNDKKQSQKIVKEISQSLADLQEVTDNRLSILEFTKNISPKI